MISVAGTAVLLLLHMLSCVVYQDRQPKTRHRQQERQPAAAAAKGKARVDWIGLDWIRVSNGARSGQAEQDLLRANG